MAKHKRHHARRARDPADPRPFPRRASGTYWLYGHHAVAAALANPRRRVLRLLVQREIAPPAGAAPEIVDRDTLEALLPPGAVHQGHAALAAPLPEVALEEACAPRGEQGNIVVVLDRVSDPRNVGAVLRSAAAFGARAVVVPDRHSPPETGALAKAASGGLEAVPLVRVGNLARALDALRDMGYWRYGLAARTGIALGDAELTGNVVLVLGAEGKGLRRLTAEHCDHLVHLPMSEAVDSLNVSAAAAICLFVASRAVGSG